MKKRPGFGLIHRKDGIWQWKCGKSYIVIYSPNEEKIIVGANKVFEGDLDRAKMKGCSLVKPYMVKNWINTFFPE